MVENASNVRAFFAGRCVLVTGGTGFLGKLLIEKLLRTCDRLELVYALARPKKDKDARQRLDGILEEAVFERLGKQLPDFRRKIRLVSGDCALPGLGLSPADAEALTSRVSVVFNVAATVRFDENLKKAIAVNIGGTKELMELCKRMRNLAVVMHVSTAYSNCDREAIGEQFYPPPITAEDALDLARILTDGQLTAFTDTLLGPFPNTYVYTKCIGEQLVRGYSSELPVGVFRPAIVISTYREPVEGWVDNVYGPTGALAAAGIGLLRTMNIDETRVAELVPADYTVNALIAAAWQVATGTFRDRGDPPVYNYHSSWGGTRITWGEYMNLAVKHGSQVPSVRSLWCYTFTAAKSPLAYSVFTAILHLLPAALVDAGLRLAGRKPRLLQIYKRLHKFSAVTSYFGTRDWTFSYANTRRLWDSLSTEDRALFPFRMEDFDWDDFMRKCVHGLRLYIFKDDPGTIARAKTRMARFVFLHASLKYTALLLLLWLAYRAATAAIRF